MVKLNASSLDWALEHVKKEGDTDIFPRLFEIDAIADRWAIVRDELLKIHVESHEWAGGRRVLIPKGKYSFRAATQLDPIDTLILSALIYEYGQHIEEKRLPLTDNIVFSHRFNPSSDGLLYDENINWNLFWEESLEKAKKINDGYVIMADVADYYNQIYHHVLENGLIEANLPTEVRTAIKKLLKKLTHTISRGIPVGPHAIHLLAEMSFNPIDNSLISHGYDFCRYVDDIHLFCESKEKAEITLWDLADILDKQQQLVLQSSKVKIMSVNEFIDLAEERVSDHPLNGVEDDILEVIEDHSSGDPYRAINFSDLDEEEMEILSEENIESVLTEYLNDNNVSRIRWLIRRLSQIGAPGGIPFLIDNMMNLLSAIGDISKYLVSTEDTFKDIDGDWDDLGKRLITLLNLPLIDHSEFLKMTIINLFGKISELDNTNYLTQIYNSEGSLFVKRKIIKAATKANDKHWLYEIRTEFDSADPWLKRSIILSSSTFPSDQRKHWLNHIKRGNMTLLEITVMEWVKSGGTI